jgi:hypothetical protein
VICWAGRCHCSVGPAVKRKQAEREGVGLNLELAIGPRREGKWEGAEMDLNWLPGQNKEEKLSSIHCFFSKAYFQIHLKINLKYF